MIASILLLALAGQAQAPAPAEPPIVVEGKKDQNCRMTRETGSRPWSSTAKRSHSPSDEQRAIDMRARAVLKLGNINPNTPNNSPPPDQR